MKRSLFACLFLVTVGCGGDEPSAEDKLQGKWAFEDSQTVCLTAYSFDGNQVEEDVICQLADDSFAIQAIFGTFTANGSSFTYTVTGSSCPDAPTAPRTVHYDFAGDQLRLVVESQVELLDRVKDTKSSGGGAAQFGCFDDDGFFTESPVKKL